MMRKPSTHITEDALADILQGYFKNQGLKNFQNGFSKDLARFITIQAKKYSLSHRSVLASSDKIEKNINRIKLSSKSQAGLFAQILILVRKKNHIRGISIIKSGTPEWFLMKEICKLATEFCNEFDLNLKEGYREYIQMGIGKMKLFNLGRFKMIHQSICSEYEALRLIKLDPEPDKTKNIHDYYMSLISERTGNTIGYENQPEKYVHFQKVNEECRILKIGYKAYIKAQFAGLEWANTFPDPCQLVGVKAIERIQTWAFKNSIKLGVEEHKINFNKIKDENNHK